MKRECVEGSLNGWVEPITSNIDRIIGCDVEEVGSTSAVVNVPGSGGLSIDIPEPDLEGGNDNNDWLMGNPHDGVIDPQCKPAAAPPTAVPEKSGKCKPLDSKSVRNVLHTVSDAYNRLDEERRFQVSALALQLQELMTLDTNKSKMVTSQQGDYCVVIPNSDQLASQPKKRLISHREQAKTASTKQLNSRLQKMGMKQVVIANGEIEVEVNGKTGDRHCQFCQETKHNFNQCNERSSFVAVAQEYLLSVDTKYALNQQSLRNRILDSMPYQPYAARQDEISYLDTLDQTSLRSNFIIHEACQLQNDQLVYCVSFLNKQAQPSEKKWISWNAMNTIITHTKVKIKFVFDETFIMQPGWVSRSRCDTMNATCPVTSAADNVACSSDSDDDIRLADLGKKSTSKKPKPPAQSSNNTKPQNPKTPKPREARL